MPKITKTTPKNPIDVYTKPMTRQGIKHYNVEETPEMRAKAKKERLQEVAIKKRLRQIKDGLLKKVIPPITQSRIEAVRIPIVKAPSADLTVRRDRIAIILKKCAIEEIRASRELLAMRGLLNAPY
jgi:hypothetical protein